MISGSVPGEAEAGEGRVLDDPSTHAEGYVGTFSQVRAVGVRNDSALPF